MGERCLKYAGSFISRICRALKGRRNNGWGGRGLLCVCGGGGGNHSLAAGAVHLVAIHCYTSLAVVARCSTFATAATIPCETLLPAAHVGDMWDCPPVCCTLLPTTASIAHLLLLLHCCGETGQHWVRV